MYWLEEHLKGSESITSRKAVIQPVQQTKREARTGEQRAGIGMGLRSQRRTSWFTAALLPQ